MAEFAGMKMYEADGEKYALYTDIREISVDCEAAYRFYFGEEKGGKCGLAKGVKVSDRSRDGKLCSCSVLVFFRRPGKDWEVSGDTGYLDTETGYEAWDIEAGKAVDVTEKDTARLWDCPWLD